MLVLADDLSCFVISLKRAEQRRREITNALNELGISFRIVDAIDAKQGDVLSRPDVDAQAGQKNMQREMLPGEFACALSHVKTLTAFLETNADYALILEDDAIVGDNLRAYLAGHHYRKAPLTQLCHQNARVRDLKGEDLFGKFKLLRPVNSPFMTAAYVVDRRCASILIDAATPVRTVADWPADLTKLGARITLPMVVTHPPHDDPAQTEIGTRLYQTLRHKYGLKRYFMSDYWLRKWLRATTTRVS